MSKSRIRNRHQLDSWTVGDETERTVAQKIEDGHARKPVYSTCEVSVTRLGGR